MQSGPALQLEESNHIGSGTKHVQLRDIPGVPVQQSGEGPVRVLFFSNKLFRLQGSRASVSYRITLLNPKP